MRRYLIAFAMALTLPGAAAAHDHLRAVSEIFAHQMDTDRDQAISFDELTAFGEAVFASMDVDADGRISLEELQEWEHGYAEIAAHLQRSDAHAAAMGRIFTIADVNSDGAVSPTEHRRGVLASARFADGDGNGVLSYDEYLDRSLVNVVMGTALGS